MLSPTVDRRYDGTNCEGCMLGFDFDPVFFWRSEVYG